ncbi:MAG TPA: alkaline phosphatase family protein [Planctomycetota bacterium]|nr:alkaline phosphatase family protein [Planctomycetota bacterium]
MHAERKRSVRSLLGVSLAALLSGLFISILAVQAALDDGAGLLNVGSSGSSVPVSFHAPLPPRKVTQGIARQVLVISVDGLRPDGITQAQAPVLMGLMERGARAEHCETVRPSITLPSHTAMLTGLDFKNHGVVWNNYRPGHIQHPTVFSVASEAGLSTAMLFAKDKFHFLANPEQVHWIYGPAIPRIIPKLEDVTKPDFKENTGPDPSGAQSASRPKAPAPAPAPALGVVPPPAGNPGAKPDALPRPPPTSKPSTSADGLARAFAAEWPDTKYQMTFIHFGEPDGAGHGRGWMSRSYLDAVLKVDTAIGKILDTLRDCGELETTAIIISADHGGLGKQHYFRQLPDTPENVTIPWICVGPGVKAGLLITRPLRTFDTAPTALSFLGLTPPERLDGRAVEEVLGAQER